MGEITKIASDASKTHEWSWFPSFAQASDGQAIFAH